MSATAQHATRRKRTSFCTVSRTLMRRECGSVHTNCASTSVKPFSPLIFFRHRVSSSRDSSWHATQCVFARKRWHSRHCSRVPSLSMPSHRSTSSLRHCAHMFAPLETMLWPHTQHLLHEPRQSVRAARSSSGKKAAHYGHCATGRGRRRQHGVMGLRLAGNRPAWPSLGFKALARKWPEKFAQNVLSSLAGIGCFPLNSQSIATCNILRGVYFISFHQDSPTCSSVWPVGWSFKPHGCQACTSQRCDRCSRRRDGAGAAGGGAGITSARVGRPAAAGGAATAERCGAARTGNASPPTRSRRRDNKTAGRARGTARAVALPAGGGAAARCCQPPRGGGGVGIGARPSLGAACGATHRG